MHKSLKSAALGAALLVAGIVTAQAQTVQAPAATPANSAIMQDQTARLPDAATPQYTPPAAVPMPDDATAVNQHNEADGGFEDTD